MRIRTPFVFLLILGTFGLVQICRSDNSSAANYAFEVSIAPESKTSDVYLSTLTITDLASGRAVARPTLRFRAGEEAATTAADGGRSIQFTVLVNQKDSTAKYNIEVTESGKTTARTNATISITQ